MLNHTNYEDIQHKYAQSIIYYKGEPIMCNGGLPKVDKCMIRYVKLGPHFGVDEVENLGDAEDPDFSDGPFKIGYINSVQYVDGNDGDLKEGTSFCARAPVRKYKQGLSSANLVFYGRGISYIQACRMPSFVDMLKGKYPTYNQAVRALNDKLKQIAYHRHFAVGQGKLDQAELFYRGQVVGQGDDFKALKLAPKFQFLQEVFEISKAA